MVITTGIGTPRSLPLPSVNRQRVVDRHRGAVGGEEARTARDAVHAERADEGRHAQPRDQGAVDGARDQRRQHGGEQARAQRQRGVDRGQGLHGPRHDHGGEAHDEADREVDAAGDDDEGLAEAEQQGHRRRDGDALQVVAVEQEGDAVGRPRPGLEEDQEQEQEQPRPGDGEERQGGMPLPLGRAAAWRRSSGAAKGWAAKRRARSVAVDELHHVGSSMLSLVMIVAPVPICGGTDWPLITA